MSPHVLIVGAGPAGVSAALGARALDLSVLLVDGASAPGGQLHSVHFHPHDVPGFESGDGAALAGIYSRQLAEASVPLRTHARAVGLEPGRGASMRPAVHLEGDERLEAEAVLIAAGVRRRLLDVPGARELHGVSYSGTRDRARLAGRDVVVVGGGDAAYENALLLAREASHVTLVVRSAPRARPEFRARVAAEPLIDVREGSRVLSILGERAVAGVRLAGPQGEYQVAAEGVVIKIGVVPNSEWCAGTVALDDDGFVRVDEHLATSASRVWAAGDITRPRPPSIPVALGQGAQAVAMIRAELQAR